MDPQQFLAASRLVIVAGKGGVGKTTVSATLATVAANLGLRVLVVEVEGKRTIPGLLGIDDLSYTEQVLQRSTGELRVRHITADQALHEYLDDHGLRRISNRLARTGALDVVATAAPGIEDILVLGKVKQLERSGAYDLVVLDAPAAGHAITFLQSARGLADAVRVGPIHTQATDVLELLGDAARTRVMLVTLPEETPVSELVETAYALEDRVGVCLGPIVVNGVYRALPGLDVDPHAAATAEAASLRPGEAEMLEAAARFRSERMALQAEQLHRLRRELPLPQLTLPHLFTPTVGPAELTALADALLHQIEELP